MPKKSKKYERVIFKPEVIKQTEEALTENLKKKDRQVTLEIRNVRLSPEEEWEHNNDEEFFADYNKGVLRAYFVKRYGFDRKISFWVYDNDTEVSVEMPNRTDVERVFNVVEANVEKYRLPVEPRKSSKVKTDWIAETVKKVSSYHPITGQKLKLALTKIEQKDTEEWQSAAMIMRDAWIILAQHLCKIYKIDTSAIPKDKVVDRLKILIDDDKVINIAKSSFNLCFKHHDREIDKGTAISCVISGIVSMQTVIREALNAGG